MVECRRIRFQLRSVRLSIGSHIFSPSGALFEWAESPVICPSGALHLIQPPLACNVYRCSKKQPEPRRPSAGSHVPSIWSDLSRVLSGCDAVIGGGQGLKTT